MKLQYLGMFDAVEVAEWLDETGHETTVRRGETVDVPDELAVRLLEQPDNWARVEESPTEEASETPSARAKPRR